MIVFNSEASFRGKRCIGPPKTRNTGRLPKQQSALEYEVQWCCVTIGTVTTRNTSLTLNAARERCVLVILHSHVCRIHRKNPSQLICCTRLPLTVYKALDNVFQHRIPTAHLICCTNVIYVV